MALAAGSLESVPRANGLRDVFSSRSCGPATGQARGRPYTAGSAGLSPPLVKGVQPCQDGACGLAYKGARDAEIRNTLHPQR